MTQYYILDDQQKPKEVSEAEHSAWKENVSEKYNREFIRDDGSKEVSLIFQGIKETGRELVLFSVRSIFSGFDGSTVTDFNHSFTTLKDATEHYENELFLNGDFETKPTKSDDKGRDIQITGTVGGGFKEWIININTKEILMISEGYEKDKTPRTTIWTTRKPKSSIHTKLTIDEVIKLVKDNKT